MTSDYTQLETYRTCPQLYDYIYNMNLQRGMNLAARFSVHMVHAPIADWYLTGGKLWGPDRWAHAWNVEVNPTDTERARDRKKHYTLVKAQEIFRLYTELYHHELDQVYTAEQVFVDGALDFLSKPDVVLTRNHTLWCVDLKATAWRFISKAVPINRQLLGQIVTVGAVGAILRVISLAGNPLTIEDFELRPSPDQRARFRAETDLKRENLERSAELNVWPREAPSACARYGEANMCEFLELCESDDPARLIASWPRADNRAYLANQKIQEEGVAT